MDVKQYWRSVADNWWLPALGLVLGGLLAAVVVLMATPLYTSETRMFVSTNGAVSVTDAVEGNQFSQDRIQSYASFLTDPVVTNAVIRDLGLQMTPAELAQKIHAEVVSGTVIMDVTVTDPSPQRAQAIAQSLTAQFPPLLTALETPEGAISSPARLTVTAEPEVPTAPSSPNVLQDLAIGLVLGLAIGVTVAILRDRLDSRVRTSEQAADAAGAPPLGLVLHDPQLAEGTVLPAGATSTAAEQFRQLQTNLTFIDLDTPVRALVVSSSLSGEGKTTVAVNLALSLARGGRSVAVVEADLRRPRLAELLGLSEKTGLTDVLSGAATVEDVVQSVEHGTVAVFCAGPRPPNPGELLSSAKMRALIDRLKRAFDLVLIDAPPLLPVADTSGLATLSDGVLLCARWGTTRIRELELSHRTLARINVRCVGVVLTVVPRRAASDEGYGRDNYLEGESPTAAVALHQALGRLLRGLHPGRTENDRAASPGAAVPVPTGAAPEDSAGGRTERGTP